LSEKETPKSTVVRFEEKVDHVLKSASKHKKESIRKSMARPLGFEFLRTLYIVGCILLDLILLPSTLIVLLERPVAFASMVIVIPAMVYIEYRLHEKWFPIPSETQA